MSRNIITVVLGTFQTWKREGIPMIPRYLSTDIATIWSDESKLRLWQETELAVIKARADLEQIPIAVYDEIRKLLLENPIDISWWLEDEKSTKHDLNSFVRERLRFLPVELQQYLHSGLTSYDTEEPAFATMLLDSTSFAIDRLAELEAVISGLAGKYRYTIMNGRTHGQEAELQTFGKRCLTWLAALRVDSATLEVARESLAYSKLSGAIGNYGSVSPQVESQALGILGFMSFYGATQIMPRELYTPLAHALCGTVLTLDKIATDIRLGARSGRPIYQESFGKKQMGSSAMPHKKNTISSEQVEGMARLAKGYCMAITDNIKTWEERDIGQSSVERVAWPDLFHVACRSMEVMHRVLSELVVYPDNMLLEVVESRGCYASGTAKEVLRELGAGLGLSSQEAYQIVQLAAFNVFELRGVAAQKWSNPCDSLEDSDKQLASLREKRTPPPVSIEVIIETGELRPSPQLSVSEQNVVRWNKMLRCIFSNSENWERWKQIFQPSYLLRHEEFLFKKMLRI